MRIVWRVIKAVFNLTLAIALFAVSLLVDSTPD